MTSIINGDLFDSGADLILIPVDTEGQMSPSFAEFFIEHNLNIPSLNMQGLGDLIIHRYNTPRLRQVGFCCTFDVELDMSSYTAIQKIGHDIGLWARNEPIKSVAAPLLGSGAGRLNPVISHTVFHDSFLSTGRGKTTLSVYIKDHNSYQRISEASYNRDHIGGAGDVIAIDAAIALVKEDPLIERIRSSDKFYYQSAIEKFQEFEDYGEAYPNFYTDLLKDFKSSRLTFRNYLATIERDTPKFEFMELCGQVVAHIDYHAYLKNHWNKTPDKRVLAKSGVHQTNWISNLIRYKEQGEDPSILPGNIRNAVLYLLYPEQEICMLSENHRKQVFEKLFSKKYTGVDDLGILFHFFRELDLTANNELNEPVLVTRALYHPAFKKIWLDKENTNYHQITEEFPKESDIDQAYQLIYECFINKSNTLDLGNCGIRDLQHIPELFECEHLEELILSNEWAELEAGRWQPYRSDNYGKPNKIDTIPGEIRRLKKLKKLIIGGDWHNGEEDEEANRWGIRNIDPIFGLSELELLNVSNNLIGEIRLSERMNRLEVLHLNNNRIYRVQGLSALKSLRELNLSNNRIVDLEFLKKVSSLQTLDLHSNQIQSLSPIEHLINKLGVANSKWELNTINVASNPLAEPSLNTIALGKEAVLRYFRDIKERDTYINSEIKLILVGNSEAGKTTLGKYLDHKIDLHEKHSATHWLAEKTIRWDYFEKDPDKQFTLRLFDFGGHDYYHDTHHLFFTQNTLYILVWDKESDKLEKRQLKQGEEDQAHGAFPIVTQDYPLRYWLDSVAHFTQEVKADNVDFKSKNSKKNYTSLLLLLQNKVGKARVIKPLDSNLLHEAYPFIYETLNVDLLAERNTGHMMDIINEMLVDAKLIGEKLPKYYLQIKEAVTSYAGKPILSIEAFNDFCNSKLNFLIDLEQTRDLAEHLKHLGLIGWFPKNTPDDKVYIDKNWLIGNIRKVLDKLNFKNGRFELDEIRKKVAPMDDEQLQLLIDVMIDYKMIFKHPYQNDYIAPLYLPERPAPTIEIFLSNTKTTHRRFQYLGYIPKHVILQLFQKYGQLIPNDQLGQTRGTYYYWKNGLIIKGLTSGEIVLINFDMGSKYGEARIDIYHLGGPDSIFIDEVTDYIRDINKDYDVDEQVTLDGIHYISLELLERYAEQGRYEFTEKTTLDIRDPETESPIFKLKDYKKYVKTMKKLKVAISYSKSDIAKVNTFLRYLNPLVHDDLIELPWYCSDLEAGCLWNEEIEKHFKEADIVFFMMSDHFFDTEYIRKHEIPNTIDRYRLDKSVKIVPILLVHYPWGSKGEYNLQDFTALPFQAKPISDYSNENMAWYMVSKKIRIMIEKSLDPGKPGGIDKELKVLYERQVDGKLDNNS